VTFTFTLTLDLDVVGGQRQPPAALYTPDKVTRYPIV
jgi:hypothetical protein